MRPSAPFALLAFPLAVLLLWPAAASGECAWITWNWIVGAGKEYGFITIPRSKHGESRRVPINTAVRSALIDLGSGVAPDSGSRLVFRGRPAQANKYFPKAVDAARAALKAAGKDTSRLTGYCWHSNRHRFASRCVMAGVDART